MQLDSALFEQIAAGLGGGVLSPDPGRREARVDVNARVTLIPLTDSLAAAPFDVNLRDVSAGGVGFLHGTPLGLDEQFVLLLPDSVAILCQVAYYQPVAEGACSIGARFLRVLRRPAADRPAAIPLAQPAPLSRRAAS
jgi:hypothetical protein